MTLYFRTWEEQKTEHALLSLITWFQAQPPAFLTNQGLRFEGNFFLLVDLESPYVYTVLFTVESFYFRPTDCFLYLLSQCDNFFVQSVLRSSLPLEPVGYSY